MENAREDKMKSRLLNDLELLNDGACYEVTDTYAILMPTDLQVNLAELSGTTTGSDSEYELLTNRYHLINKKIQSLGVKSFKRERDIRGRIPSELLHGAEQYEYMFVLKLIEYGTIRKRVVIFSGLYQKRDLSIKLAIYDAGHGRHFEEIDITNVINIRPCSWK